MTNENITSWLVKTRQMWKFWLFFGLAALDFLLLVLMIWNINDPQGKLFVKMGLDQLQIRTAFLTLGIVTLTYLFFSIKCPSCKKRPVYRILNTNGLSKWVTALISFKHCPICGYSGNSEIEET
jgi:hypothetical protein